MQFTPSSGQPSIFSRIMTSCLLGNKDTCSGTVKSSLLNFLEMELDRINLDSPSPRLSQARSTRSRSRKRQCSGSPFRQRAVGFLMPFVLDDCLCAALGNLINGFWPTAPRWLVSKVASDAQSVRYTAIPAARMASLKQCPQRMVASMRFLISF